jgi:hypothetical protein
MDSTGIILYFALLEYLLLVIEHPFDSVFYLNNFFDVPEITAHSLYALRIQYYGKQFLGGDYSYAVYNDTTRAASVTPITISI